MGYLESLQLFYTPNNELEKSIKIHQQGFDVTTTTHYYYDAFGRRIGKSSSTQKSSKLNQRGQLVRFLKPVLEKGDTVIIEGEYRACKSCKGKMNDVKEFFDNEVDIIYKSPELI